MIRRFGTPPRANTRYTRRLGAYAILPRNGALLVTHQEEPEPEFQLPGGGVDPGESPFHGLRREVREETGWIIGAARRVGVFRRFHYMPEYDLMAEKVCMIYLARPVRSLGPPTEPGHTALWMEPNLAAELVANPGDRHFVRQFILGL